MRLGLILRLGLPVLAGIVMGMCAVRRPSNERTWVQEQAVLPRIRFEGSTVHIDSLRNFRYTAADSFTVCGSCDAL